MKLTNVLSADNFLLQETTTSLLYFRTSRSSRSWLLSSLPMGAWSWMWMEGGKRRSDEIVKLYHCHGEWGSPIIIYSQLSRPSWHQNLPKIMVNYCISLFFMIRGFTYALKMLHELYLNTHSWRNMSYWPKLQVNVFVTCMIYEPSLFKMLSVYLCYLLHRVQE